MSDFIAVAQRKGGVGKTTLSVSLAAELRRRGRDVVLVDCDPRRLHVTGRNSAILNFPSTK
jgi:chromosome partitioning protein